MPVFFYAVLGLIIFCVVALLLTPNLFRPSPEAQRILDVVQSTRPDQRTISSKEQLQTRLLGLATGLRIRLGLAENPVLKARLAAAGIKGTAAADIFFASQFLVPATGAVVGTLIGTNTLSYVLGLGALGYMAPNMWLNWKTSRRRKRIRRSIPDALDLMVICVDAGLGLDQAKTGIDANHHGSEEHTPRTSPRALVCPRPRRPAAVPRPGPPPPPPPTPPNKHTPTNPQPQKI